MADSVAGKVIYKLELDTRQFDKKLDKGRKAVKSLGKDTEDSSKRMDSAIGNVAKKTLKDINKGFIETRIVADQFGKSTVKSFTEVTSQGKRVIHSQEDIAQASKFLRNQMTGNIGAVVSSLETMEKKTRRVKKETSSFRKEIAESANAIRALQTAFSGFSGAALIGAITLGAGVLVELAGAAVLASGALLAVPAAAGVAAGALATTRVALIGLDDAFKAIGDGDIEKLNEALVNLSPNAQRFVLAAKGFKDAFDPVRRTIQDKLFVNLDKDLRRITDGGAKLLERGMGRVATSMNGVLREAAKLAESPVFKGTVERTMAGTAKTIDILKGALQPLAVVIDRVVAAGMPFVQQFATWLVELSKAGAAFLNTHDGMEMLQGAIKTGIGVLQQIMGLVGALAGTFGALLSASVASGGTLIQTLTKILNKFNAWATSAEGQEKLTKLFSFLNQVLEESLFIIGAVAGVFLNLVTFISDLPGPVRSFVAQLVALGIVMTPVILFFARFITSLQALKPVFKLIGRFSTFLGKQFFKMGKAALKAASQAIAGFLRTAAQAVVAAARTTASWVAAAARFVASWTVAIAKTVARMALVATRASVSALATAAAWIGQAVRVAAVWTAQMAVVVARQFWAGLQSQSPALAAGLVWVAQAVKAAAQWTVSMAVVVAQGAVAAGRSVGQAALASLAWVKNAGLVAVAWSKNMAKVVASMVAAGSGSTARAVKAALAWIAQPVLIAMAWTANLARVVLTQIAFALQSGVQATLAAGPWLMNAGRIAMAWILNFARMLPFIAGTTVGIIANAVLASGAWIKAAATMGATMLRLGAQALLAGARIALGWLIAMGPIGIAIAIVLALVAIIILNFNKIKKFISDAWNKISGWAVKAWNNIKRTVSDAWNNLKSSVSRGVSNVVNFVKELPGKILRALGDTGKMLWDAGKNILQGLGNGIQSAVDGVKNKLKDFAKGALDSIKSFFGIHSPSRVMAQLGKFMMQGFGQGIDRNASLAERAAQRASQATFGALNGNMAIDPSVTVGAATALRVRSDSTFENGSSSTSPQAQPNITINLDMSGIMTRSRADMRELTKQMLESVNEELRARQLPEIGNGTLNGRSTA